MAMNEKVTRIGSDAVLFNNKAATIIALDRNLKHSSYDVGKRFLGEIDTVQHGVLHRQTTDYQLAPYIVW